MVSGSNYWEYLEVAVDSDNQFIVDGVSVSIHDLGRDRWEFAGVMPNKISGPYEDGDSLYFARRSPSYHVAIFKRPMWIED